jgi:tetratricopeptide (TPR) repeat protein
MTLVPMTMADADLLSSVATLPAAYARALQVPLTPAETARIEKAARPTASLRSLQLFARGQAAFYASANQDAVDLLLRSIEADPPFAVAQYALGTVHRVLGNRWKAAAQFRAATLIDPTFPEPFKALGDLFLAAPRKLHDLAGEVYSKAIELRPFYADAYVGLGRARAAKGDLYAARTAFEKAVTFDPFNSAAFAELGMIYATNGRCADSIKAYQRAFELDPQASGPREACWGPDYF